MVPAKNTGIIEDEFEARDEILSVLFRKPK